MQDLSPLQDIIQPNGHAFEPINIIWTALVGGHPRTISAKLFKIQPVVFDKNND